MQAEHQQHHGATKPTYNIIFVILFVATLLELLGSAIGGFIGAAMLIILMTAKAALVVAYYMHLKYDRPILTWMFVVPVIMGIAVILSLQGLAGY